MEPVALAVSGPEAVSSAWYPGLLLNCFVEQGTGLEKSRYLIRQWPGTGSPLASVSGEIRALHEFAGTLYAVAGAYVWRVGAGGTLTKLPGDEVGAGDLVIASSPTQMVIVNGTDAYVVNGTTVALITDSDMSQPDWVTWMSSRFVYGTSTREFFVSAVDDATTVDTLDFATAESLRSATVRGVADHGELWLLGEQAGEVWGDSGAPFPLQRIGGGFVERGIAGKNALCREDNTIFWLGNDRIVYKAAGYIPQRVSSHALETDLRKIGAVSDARLWSFTMDGHKFVVLSLPDGGKSYALNIETGGWCEVSSFRDSVDTIWRATAMADCYGKTWIGDDRGGIYILDAALSTDANGALAREFATAILQNSGGRLSMYTLQLDIEAGLGLTTGQGSDPQIMMRYTDNGRTFSNEMWRSCGAGGEYDLRVIWRKLGSFFQRSCRFRVTDPIPVRAIAAYADLS